MAEEKQKIYKKKLPGKWWIWVIVIIILYLIGSASIKDAKEKAKNDQSLTNQTQDQNQTNTQKEDKPQQINQLGLEGFLRLPDNNDSEQIIILTENKEDYEKVNKSLTAKDYQGLLEIAGAFGVSNGTKIKLIDSSFGMRKVRILEGVREVDSDKIGKSGWVPMEYVVDK